MACARWTRVDLAPCEGRQVTVSIDPRLLATSDEAARLWRIRPGAYQLTPGFDSQQRELEANFGLQPMSLRPSGNPTFSFSARFIRSPETLAATSLTAVTTAPAPSQNSALSGVT